MSKRRKGDAERPPPPPTEERGGLVAEHTHRTYLAKCYIEVLNCSVFYFTIFMVRAVLDLLMSNGTAECLTSDWYGILVGISFLAAASGMVVYVSLRIGSIVDSGLCNPVFTVCKALAGRMGRSKAPIDVFMLFLLIVTEVLCAFFAAAFVYILFSQFKNLQEEGRVFLFGLVRPSFFCFEFSATAVFAAEFIGAATLMLFLMVYSVDRELYHVDQGGVSVVGIAYAAITLAFALLSSAVFNPLLHFPIALVSLSVRNSPINPFSNDFFVYYIAPGLGAVSALIIYYIFHRLFHLGDAIYVAGVLSKWVRNVRGMEMISVRLDDIAKSYELPLSVAKQSITEDESPVNVIEED